MAMTCCAAIRKLGSERISCPLFSNSIEDALFELMDATNSLVSLCKLHHLATEAGFEEEFLSYFGSKILPHKNIEDVEFWICLVQRKLSTAFHRESVTSNTNKVSNSCIWNVSIMSYDSILLIEMNFCRWKRIVWLLLHSLLILEEKQDCSCLGMGLGFLISKQEILLGAFCSLFFLYFLD